MKMKKLARVFTSAALVSAMVATMGGMTSFAAVESIPLTKTVTTDGNTYAPNTSFTFSVVPGGSETRKIGDVENVLVSGGVEEGLVFANGNSTVTFAPEGTSPAKEGYTDTSLALSINSTKFTVPGVYHYVVQEESGSYEGIEYDTVTRDIYLYVENVTGGVEVTNAIIAIDGVKQNGLDFTNNYGKEGEPETPDGPKPGDTTHDLTVTKVVTGNQGDKSKAFDFSVSVAGGDGEWYKVVFTNQNNETTESHLVSGADPVIYPLKDGESIQIYGLTESDKYTVTEADYGSDGYTTTNGSKTDVVTDDGDSYTVTNDKSVTTPTGIVLSFAPYILLVALAGVFGVLFLRRKKEEF